MDVVSTVFSLVGKGMEALKWAQDHGYLGGSNKWISMAIDGAALFGRAQILLGTLAKSPEEYDRIDKLPQPEKEAEIIKRLYPTPLANLVERVRTEMGGT